MTDDTLITETPEVNPPEDTEGTNVSSEETKEDAGEEATWMWTDDQPGQGEKPDWLKSDKYKSVAAQAEAYSSLEKKFGNLTSAPDEYEIPTADVFRNDIVLPEGTDFNLSAEDPLLQAFNPVAKEIGLDQEGYNKMVKIYIQQQVTDYVFEQENIVNQKKLLGDNADSRISNVAKWAGANLSTEEFESFKGMLTTADSIKVVESIIGKTRNSQLPDPSNITPMPAMSLDDAKAMQGKKDENGRLLIETDLAYRKQVERAFRDAVGDGVHKIIVGQ